MIKKIIAPLTIILMISSCQTASKQSDTVYPATGRLERLDAALDSIVDSTAIAEIIATGFTWCEGPLWIADQNMLLFSDVPANTVYQWTTEKGKEIYLTPSGYTDSTGRSGEMGSNGLLLDNEGRLVLCQHGNRQMARMDAPVNDPKPRFITLAGQYQGKRLNSPNDAVYNSKGELFFTDPPYGFETQSDDDPAKELSFNGVYKLKINGELVLLTDSIPRPNGIVILPGEEQLIIASSDGHHPNWYLYDIAGDSLRNVRLFYPDINAYRNERGGPDGLKADRQGNVFATGPGGIWIFNRQGKILGKLKLDQAASNCSLSEDEKTLYITNHTQVLRFRMRK